MTMHEYVGDVDAYTYVRIFRENEEHFEDFLLGLKEYFVAVEYSNYD